MKHTKGKWEVKTGLTQLNCYAVQENGEGIGVCTINHTIPEYVENAKLISKAPEMYEALKKVLDVNGYSMSADLINELESLLKEIDNENPI